MISMEDGCVQVSVSVDVSKKYGKDTNSERNSSTFVTECYIPMMKFSRPRSSLLLNHQRQEQCDRQDCLLLRERAVGDWSAGGSTPLATDRSSVSDINI